MIEREELEGQLTLTLSRPDRGNALAADMVEALLEQVAQAVANPDLHTLVLRGAGRHFCTGLDLSDLATSSDGDLLHRIVRIETLLSMLWHAPLRTVALAQGRTWGAGADLFAVCEQRVASGDASFRFPGAQFGIVLGTRRLATRIGVDATRQLVTEGGEMDASQALRCGLVSSIGTGFSGGAPRIDARTAAEIRAATREDHRDADLATLVRSAARPGLKARMAAYRERMLAASKPRA